MVSLVLVLTVLPANAQPTEKLLQVTDFKYLGAFRVPKGDLGGILQKGLAYGGSVIAFNPDKNSLFLVGHDHNQQVAEIAIPDLVISRNINDLNTAKVVQDLADITEGNLRNLKADGGAILANGTKIGGLVKYGDKLVGSVYAYYDGDHAAVRSHFTSGLVLSEKEDFRGMYQVGNKPKPVPQAGFVAGYMTLIPPSWQTELGGTVLTGMSALSILNRTSSGPAAFAFDPASLGATPALATALLYYPIDHQTLGTYYTSRTLYNKGSSQSGVVFPRGTRSVIFTGMQGVGEACYGPGTKDSSEQGNRSNTPPPHNTCGGIPMTDTADPCCYDPVNANKGAHAYPYTYFVWAYDAADLLRVRKRGKIADDPSPNLADGVPPTSSESYQPWHIKPYAAWEIALPFAQQGYSIASGASAYDEKRKIMFLVQVGTDNFSWPVIHAFKVNTDTP